MLAETLEGLSTALFLVDVRGRVIHANGAARDVLAMDDVLRSIGGRLVARDARTNQTLNAALTLTSLNGECYVAHVLPLSSGERRRAGVAYAATAAVFVRKTALGLPTSAELIGRTYMLTPTEVRVLLAVADEGGVPEVAQVLGVAETTVKFHLGYIYAKTGAYRQTALVNLVASFSNPLLD